VRKIRQGLKEQTAVEQLAAEIGFFFKTQLADHFSDEELYIFSLLDTGDPLFIRGLAEHGEIKRLAAAILKDKKINDIKCYADMLEAHIRFEERELFEYLQLQFPVALEKLVK